MLEATEHMVADGGRDEVESGQILHIYWDRLTRISGDEPEEFAGGGVILLGKPAPGMPSPIPKAIPMPQWEIVTADGLWNDFGKLNMEQLEDFAERTFSYGELIFRVRDDPSTNALEWFGTRVTLYGPH